MKRVSIESVGNTKRITGFSDAVFAVAITLLVLQIPIPIKAPNRELLDDLSDSIPMFISFFISFWVVAQFWLKHLNFNSHVKHYNIGLISANFLFLMVITFLPFPTAVYGTHSGDNAAAAMYAATISAAGMVSFLMWRIVVRHPELLLEESSQETVRHASKVSLVSPIYFAASIIVVFIYEPAVVYVWIFFGFAGQLLRRL